MIGLAAGGGRATARRVTPSPTRAAARRGYHDRLDVLRTLTLEVALCAIAGDSVGETARYLELSPATVRRHIALALAELGCADVAELAGRFGAPEMAAA
jgi:DNA-binding CsgD family transcriptional regulator